MDMKLNQTGDDNEVTILDISVTNELIIIHKHILRGVENK